MSHTLTELAAFLQQQGMPCQIAGDACHRIASVATLDDAQADQVSFLANPKYEKTLATTQAGAVVVKTGQQAPGPMNLLQVPDPYAAITLLMIKIHGFRRHQQMGISEKAQVAASAKIGRNANIWPFVTVCENVVIGDDVTIYPGCFIAEGCKLGNSVVLMPNVVLYDQVILGNRVTIHAGTVVGEDGLGFAPVGQKWEKIPQVGSVEIGDDVELGANCSIDRATLGKTVIAKGTKFSNLIAIGHGCKIGENCMFVAQVGIAGSVTVGNHVTMAGQAGVAGHISIGDNATIAAKAGVANDVPAGETYLGAPAAPMAQKKREFASITKLPEMRQKLRKLEATVEALQREIDALKARP
jgi:UDP-3-O-[3-hydroxymyristoyl] glucosamine N-acyltransferase